MRAKEINDEMKLAASEALANLITDEELSPEYIIPKAFDKASRTSGSQSGC